MTAVLSTPAIANVVELKPSIEPAIAKPTVNKPSASPHAFRLLTRFDGSGRKDRNFSSSRKSQRSLSTIPKR
jgi:hypothetical protein